MYLFTVKWAQALLNTLFKYSSHIKISKWESWVRPSVILETSGIGYFKYLFKSKKITHVILHQVPHIVSLKHGLVWKNPQENTPCVRLSFLLSNHKRIWGTHYTWVTGIQQQTQVVQGNIKNTNDMPVLHFSNINTPGSEPSQVNTRAEKLLRKSSALKSEGPLLQKYNGHCRIDSKSG